ncbi:MAG: glycosyltransferase family 2 protein [Cytophagaceae bacterium]|nr:MAG: glycosyltransferase family 2 protein [Cytophagaceae bacterium]
MTLLSIVVPCYQRHDMLGDCLASVERAGNEVQIVLVDDGSSPPLEGVFKEHAIGIDKYFRQDNRGRAAALREGLLRAEGEYVMLMDSDDEFILGGIPKILEDIDRSQQQGGIGFVYECADYDSGRVIAGLSSAPAMATLLALRADHNVRGDLKEVVRRSILLEELYPDPLEERRVPTSYIWAGVSRHGPVLIRPYPIVRHRYLPGGMTKTIRQLKRNNPKWLCQTYFLIYW